MTRTKKENDQKALNIKPPFFVRSWYLIDWLDVRSQAGRGNGQSVSDSSCPVFKACLGSGSGSPMEVSFPS